MKHFINLTSCVLNKLHIIEVCENEEPQDYKIITNLIKNIPTV